VEEDAHWNYRKKTTFAPKLSRPPNNYIYLQKSHQAQKQVFTENAFIRLCVGL